MGRFLFLIFGATVWTKNRQNLRREGAVLILSNHQSISDPPALQFGSHRLIHFMARKPLFDMPQISWLLRWWRAFPVLQGAADRTSIRNALDLLARGKAVAMFPEGRLSDDGQPLPILRGAALIVQHANVPVICVGIQGSRHLVPNPKEVPQWSGRPIVIRWGEERSFEPETSKEAILEWIASEFDRLTRD